MKSEIIKKHYHRTDRQQIIVNRDDSWQDLQHRLQKMCLWAKDIHAEKDKISNFCLYPLEHEWTYTDMWKTYPEYARS